MFGITCPTCNGGKRALVNGEEATCPDCEGRGDRRYFRCPTSQVSRDASQLVAAWSHYQNGHLPEPGGMNQQVASFVHGLGVLSAEKAAIEKMERRGR